MSGDDESTDEGRDPGEPSVGLVDEFGRPVERTQGDPNGNKADRYARHMRDATIAIVVFTAIQVLVSHCQWRVMEQTLIETKKSNELTRWNVESELRPWML